MIAASTAKPQIEVSIVVPARNEEACLARCLKSLAMQAGVTFEIIVVDDGSTDHTRDIARSFPGVRVIEPGPLPPGWSGKNNAVAAGASAAQGEWLLVTDADTQHLPGSLRRSLDEAHRKHASMLSYSPEQEVRGFWENAVMPVIFAELAVSFKPSEVSDPDSPAAAANGQYILISREAYDAIGGHAAVASSLLEDVALASAVKQSGRRIFFRFGGDAVRTRMYRSFEQLREGWTKNLALLFPNAVTLAAKRLAEFAAIMVSAVVLAVSLTRSRLEALFAASVLVILLGFLFIRIRKAHFSWRANFLSPLGLPIFSYLLLRSRISYKAGTVRWKGRTYGGGEIPPKSPTGSQSIKSSEQTCSI